MAEAEAEDASVQLLQRLKQQWDHLQRKTHVFEDWVARLQTFAIAWLCLMGLGVGLHGSLVTLAGATVTLATWALSAHLSYRVKMFEKAWDLEQPTPLPEDPALLQRFAWNTRTALFKLIGLAYYAAVLALQLPAVESMRLHRTFGLPVSAHLAIDMLQGFALGYAWSAMRDSTVRSRYSFAVKTSGCLLLRAVDHGHISSEQGAQAAYEMRNDFLDIARHHLGAYGLAVSRRTKRAPPTLEALRAKYLPPGYADLGNVTPRGHDVTNRAIIQASGRSRARFNAIAVFWNNFGVFVIAVLAVLLVAKIATNINRNAAAIKEAVSGLVVLFVAEVTDVLLLRVTQRRYLPPPAHLIVYALVTLASGLVPELVFSYDDELA